MINDELFPKVTGNKGSVYPVYFSPIVGSGERICIIGASIIEEMNFAVAPAMSEDMATLIFGGTKIINIVNEALEAHIGKHGTLNDFISPINGIHIGYCDVIKGVFRDHEMALKTVFRNHAMFYREAK